MQATGGRTDAVSHELFAANARWWTPPHTGRHLGLQLELVKFLQYWVIDQANSCLISHCLLTPILLLFFLLRPCRDVCLFRGQGYQPVVIVLLSDFVYASIKKSWSQSQSQTSSYKASPFFFPLLCKSLYSHRFENRYEAHWWHLKQEKGTRGWQHGWLYVYLSWLWAYN